MKQAPYHHVCLLVPNIEAAVRWFSDVLGITFREPQRVATRGHVDPGQFGDEEPHESEAYLTVSVDGPPYYELAEARGTGLHSLERHGAGLHHVAVFVPDVDAVIAELATKGIGVEERMLAPDGSTLVCWSERASETGLMVEYMHEGMRPAIQGWIETGAPPVTASSSAAT
jgi:catechol 2,3-dioxygenase-like lactoylglutathione lyase family enzyme